MEYEARQETLVHTSEVQPGGHDGEAIRMAQGCLLDELPGIVFAALTLLWIASCFAGMEWRLDTGAIAARAHQVIGLAVSPPHSLTVAWRIGTAGAFLKRAYDFIAWRSGG